MAPMSIHALGDYDVDPQRGFLPADDPLDHLPPAYAVWEQTAATLPALLMAGRLRPVLDQLPLLTLDRLESGPQRRRAMLLLSIMGNAYVWAEAEPVLRLPHSIAVPWWQLAEALGRPPITAHASMVLNNWRRLDANGPICLENLATQQLFLGGIDERWFYLVTVAIEADGAPAIRALVAAQTAVAAGNTSRVLDNLQIIDQAVARMLATLERMPEKCDPYIFYRRVRPFVAGWPEPGVIYTGVSEEPQLFAGGSAAQSSLLQALDAGLGIVHTDEKTRPFLMEMRCYMPPKHRAFIEALEARPSLRRFIQIHAPTHPSLADTYNACIRQMDRFRRKHIEISVRYIVHQAPEKEEAKGTGGTSFVPFLSEARKETKQQIMNLPVKKK